MKRREPDGLRAIIAARAGVALTDRGTPERAPGRDGPRVPWQSPAPAPEARGPFVVDVSAVDGGDVYM